MLGRVYMGRYETIRLLGEGGMGKAFLARHLELNEPVVVKVMHDHIAANPIFRERFQDEMALMARLDHPHAVALHEASLDDPHGPCIVMEYLPGVSLDKLLQKNTRFNPARLHRFLRQLCDVLQTAHDLGIVHRDLKPANLMVLDPDTPSERLKVMDFGIAKLVESGEHRDVRQTVRIKEYAVGTPGYMSPEQVRGDKVDNRSDIYSVGAILFQLLTGQLPFTGKTVMEILMAQAADKLPTFASLGVIEMVPPAVEAVVGRALALKPDARPQSMRELFEVYEVALLGRRRGQEEPAPTTAAEASPDKPAPPAAAPAAAAPGATVEYIEAYMAEQLVIHKLQAFVDEVGGTIVDNSPGLIRVQLRMNRAALSPTGRRGLLAWFGSKYGLVNMDLQMKKKTDANKRNLLQITVLLQPADGTPAPEANPEWTTRCKIITSALKAYFMAQS